MEKQLLDLLQNLQESYVTLVEIPLIITDCTGNPITQLSGDKQVCNQLLSSPNFFQLLGESIKTYSTLRYPLLVNSSILPDGKELIAPIRIDHETLFIWAGCVVERNRSIAEENGNFSLSFSSKELIEKLSILEKMAEISHILIKSQEQLNEHNRNVEIIYAFSKTQIDHNDGINELLSLVKKLGTNIDFVGIGMIEKPDFVSVTHFIGHLNQAVIPTQSTFFQQVLLQKQFGYWENLNDDLRGVFFSTTTEKLTTFFCFPLMLDNNINGFLFGGSFGNGHFNKNTLNIVLIISRLLSKKQTINHYKTKQDSYLMRQNSITHISKVMATVQDLQQILELMTDLAHNVIHSKFASFLLHDNTNIVKGNLEEINIHHYFKQLRETYFSPDSPKSNANRAFLTDGPCGEMMECPIIVDYKLIGILSVKLYNTNTIKEDEAFLLSLASITSLVIKNNHFSSNTFLHVNPYKFLFHILGQWNQKEYQFTLLVKNLVKAFAERLLLSTNELTTVVNSSLVSSYSIDYLIDVLSSNKVIETLRNARLILDYSFSQNQDEMTQLFSRESQILALVIYYFNNQRKTANLYRLHLVDKQLHGEFLLFLDTNKNLIDELQDSSSRSHQTYISIENPEESNFSELLTDREQEILELILNGLNNKEISEKLYISVHTVKNHITNIYKKLGVTDRAQIFSYIYQMNMKLR